MMVMVAYFAANQRSSTAADEAPARVDMGIGTGILFLLLSRFEMLGANNLRGCDLDSA